MTNEEFHALREGDIVVGASSGLAYIITGNYGDHCTAVRSVDITHPDEWSLIQKDEPPHGAAAPQE
jgi:hypothetical protein